MTLTCLHKGKIMEITTLVRVFNYNGMQLVDPGLQFSPEDVKEIYSATFPEITAAGIEGPVTKDDKLHYTFHRAIGTKGACEIKAFGEQKLVSQMRKVNGLTYIEIKPATMEPTLMEKAKIAAEKLGQLVDKIVFYPGY